MRVDTSTVVYNSTTTLHQVISILLIWALTLRGFRKALHAEIDNVQVRLKMEVYERTMIIDQYHIHLGFDNIRDQEKLQDWIASLGALGVRHGDWLQKTGRGGLLQLCQMTDYQLRCLLAKHRITPEDAAALLAAVEQKRLEFV
mmetsp:Transcript_24435/g.34494  ORF Transcript_24435/g.34494 Transcript_24435/m.34494 type:complete len:144 (-) Transcript_24435:128-559(-)